MDKQFTASEVRDAARNYNGDTAAPLDMLRAFADLLEAREKAVPVMVVNHVSSAEHDLPIGMKLYTHPSPADAERLAEALRDARDIVLAFLGDVAADGSRCGMKQAVIKNMFASLLDRLAAHSAQAQPPAASVTDAMQELADKYHELLWAVARKFPGETRHETALRYIREAECQEAALAAQENPNG